eukprot:TRINITY_DN8298_c0_g1_i4.p7 TRINITY_DN8298_c0_g1~~TRINITY_DN8298_c0_g1_i4.p7  ORF type:complete len:147 (+),score=11.29 TRINITY_DN8298_c0_g1_i4:1200-1640(+)
MCVFFQRGGLTKYNFPPSGTCNENCICKKCEGIGCKFSFSPLPLLSASQNSKSIWFFCYQQVAHNLTVQDVQSSLPLYTSKNKEFLFFFNNEDCGIGGFFFFRFNFNFPQDIKAWQLDPLVQLQRLFLTPKKVYFSCYNFRMQFYK